MSILRKGRDLDEDNLIHSSYGISNWDLLDLSEAENIGVETIDPILNDEETDKPTHKINTQERQSKSLIARIMIVFRSAKYVLSCVDKGHYRVVCADSDYFNYEDKILSSEEHSWYIDHDSPVKVLQEFDTAILNEPPYQIFITNVLKESTKERITAQEIKLAKMQSDYAYLRKKADSEKFKRRENIMAHAQKSSSNKKSKGIYLFL
jgi:hypothetical protein